MRSVQPVLHLQTRHLGEITQVSREHRGVEFERDTRDTQIHRSDADTDASQSVKVISGLRRPWQEEPLRKLVETVLELFVGSDSSILLPMGLYRAEPTFEDFLCGNYAEEGILTCALDSRSQTGTLKGLSQSILSI
jgi:hypothetical protein